MFFANFVERIHVRRLTIQVNGNDSARSACDRHPDLSGVDVVIDRIDVDRNDRRPNLLRRQPSGNKRVSRNDHFIAWANSQGLEQQTKRLQAVANPNGVLNAHVGCKVVFELFDFGTQDEVSGSKHAGDRRLKGRPQFRVLSLKAEKLHNSHIDA